MFIGIHRRNEQDNEHLRANEAPHKKREPANAQNRTFAGYKKMVRVTGLEPVRHATHAPQTCLSASSSTLAYHCFLPHSLSALIIYHIQSHLSSVFLNFFISFDSASRALYEHYKTPNLRRFHTPNLISMSSLLCEM